MENENGRIPLEKKVIIDSANHSVSALDVSWVRDEVFVKFPKLPCVADSDWVNQWSLSSNEVDRICKWLLCLPHHRFWSQIIYGPYSFYDMIDSFLQNCPRVTEPDRLQLLLNADFDWQKMYRSIMLILTRMATCQESVHDFFSPQFFSKTIWMGKRPVWSLWRLMDMIVVFRPQNEKLVNGIVYSLLQLHPQLNKELQATADQITKRLDACEQSIRVPDPKIVLPDLVHFIMDLVHVLVQFLNCFPSACIVWYDCTLANRLALFYDSFFPVVQRYNISLEKLAYIQHCFVQLYRLIVKSCIEKIDEPCSKNVDKNSFGDAYLDTMTCLLDAPLFSVVYLQNYSFADDCKLFAQKGIQLDENRIQYIAEGLNLSLPDSLIVPSNFIAKSSSTDNKQLCDQILQLRCSDEKYRNSTINLYESPADAAEEDVVACEESKLVKLKSGKKRGKIELVEKTTVPEYLLYEDDLNDIREDDASLPPAPDNRYLYDDEFDDTHFAAGANDISPTGTGSESTSEDESKLATVKDKMKSKEKTTNVEKQQASRSSASFTNKSNKKFTGDRMNEKEIRATKSGNMSDTNHNAVVNVQPVNVSSTEYNTSGRDRRNKERHKAAAANHRRKDMQRRKMSKGMF